LKEERRREPRLSPSIQSYRDYTRNETEKNRATSLQDHGHDPEEYDNKMAAYIEYANWLKKHRDAQDQLQKLETARERAEMTRDTALAEKYITPEKREEVLAFKKSYTELVDVIHTAKVNRAAADARLTTLKDQLTTYENEQQTREDVAKVRKALTRAREVLHRDQLPKLVMQKMLYGINVLLDSYLSLFSVGFTAKLNDNFDFESTFPGQEPSPSEDMSGGQQVALSVAFRFAVSDLNSSSIPLLVLDEPTNHMDAANMQNMCDIIEKARQMTEAGVIVLIATHKEILMPSFTRTINVEEIV
jgi:exonuclease SbcC